MPLQKYDMILSIVLVLVHYVSWAWVLEFAGAASAISEWEDANGAKNGAGGAHWSAAAEDVPGLHGTRDEAAWLEPELAALPGRRPARATRPASAAPVRRMEAGRGGGSDEDALKQLLTHALGEEVHRALLTEVLTQKAGTEFAGCASRLS